MLFGKIITKSSPYQFTESNVQQDAGQVLQITNVVLAPNSKENATLWIKNKSQSFLIASLTKEQPHTTLNIFLSLSDQSQLFVKGNGIIHVVGIFQPEKGADFINPQDFKDISHQQQQLVKKSAAQGKPISSVLNKSLAQKSQNSINSKPAPKIISNQEKDDQNDQQEDQQDQEIDQDDEQELDDLQQDQDDSDVDNDDDGAAPKKQVKPNPSSTGFFGGPNPNMNKQVNNTQKSNNNNNTQKPNFQQNQYTDKSFFHQNNNKSNQNFNKPNFQKKPFNQGGKPNNFNNNNKPNYNQNFNKKGYQGNFNKNKFNKGGKY